MTNWFKSVNQNSIIKKIKNILKEHPFTQEIRKYYHIPSEDIDNELKIEFVDLHGKFAEGNGELIKLDNKLLNKSFFKKNFHFVIHEFFHWLKRRAEKRFYFNDSEEIQSFVLQMTWELISGKSKEEILKTFVPIIKSHFKNDKQRFNEVFKEMMDKALNLNNLYRTDIV